jgi:hypothetical protein
MADGEVKVIITDDGSSAQTAAEIGKATARLLMLEPRWIKRPRNL